MNGGNTFEQALFNASVSYHEQRINLGEDSAHSRAARVAMLAVYNDYLAAGGTRGEAEQIVAEGRLEAAMSRVRNSGTRP